LENLLHETDKTRNRKRMVALVIFGCKETEILCFHIRANLSDLKQIKMGERLMVISGEFYLANLPRLGNSTLPTR
jgi:hypothetical protein